MIKTTFSLLTLTLALVGVASCNAQSVEVTGGRTDGTFSDSLELVGLSITGFSADTIVPSPRGVDWVGFEVNGRAATNRPTTFAYEANVLLPVSGRLEHTGSVFMNSTNPNLGLGPVEIGNFSIGYDAGRVSAMNSGFFIESTVGIRGILFDIEAGTGGTFPALESGIQVESGLLVSPELATILGSPLVVGADVGAFSINGTSVPDPVILGDVNMDGAVNFLDISPFISALSSGEFQAEADINSDTRVDFLDILPFISLLSGP